MVVVVWTGAAVILGCAGVLLAAGEGRHTAAVQHINLAERLASGTLRTFNREVTQAPDRSDAVYVPEKPGNGVVWIEGTDLAEGTIELEVRGRDVVQQSFVGVAFHGKNDTTYEAVYLRPFNFRSDDPVRRQHAVQYIVLPDYDWPRLRKEFPEEFENPVDASVVPTAWVPLRVIIKGETVQIYAGTVQTPSLEVRTLGQLDRGMIGLWTGNNSDGAFANLRISAAR